MFMCLQLGCDAASTNCEEERANKANRSNVAGDSISEVVEFNSTEDTSSRYATFFLYPYLYLHYVWQERKKNGRKEKVEGKENRNNGKENAFP